jgi:uncharacterized protein YbjT (DUF2867 family)
MALNADSDQSTPPILLTGATGYVGGRLLDALAKGGRRVRCLVRDPERLQTPASADIEVVQADVLDPGSLKPALYGVDVAYYLVHSMGAGKGFEERDRQAARNFARVARDAGLRRIVYLGALAEPGRELSPHFRSRLEVGELLRGSGVPTTEFRASIVIGPGSLSFEIMRALVERLPVMITPRWVREPCQPIAIEDVIAYLIAALDRPAEGNEILEIGGADQVSYRDLMLEYARQRGLRRLLIRVPVLTPYLSSLWLALVTPLHFRVGRRLIESLRAPSVVRDDAALRAFDVRPCGFREAIRDALDTEDREFAHIRWSEELAAMPGRKPYGGFRLRSRLIDPYTVGVPCPPLGAFGPIQRIGGEVGWYYGKRLWELRGMIDLLLGGPGLRRGRRHPESLAPGDPVDCWCVEVFEPGHRLRLAAEMKMPGRAWLDFEVEGEGDSTTIRQTAIFDPIGLRGLLYWYAVYPLHVWLFKGMLRRIAERATTEC